MASKLKKDTKKKPTKTNNNYHNQRIIMTQNGYFKDGNKEPKIYHQVYDSADPTNLSPKITPPFVPPNFDNIQFNFQTPFVPNVSAWPWPQFNFPPNTVSTDYPDWFKEQMAQVEKETDDIKKKDPRLYLNKALFYYYNQYPNFNPFLKPHASPAFANFSFSNASYYDKAPQYYYDVAQKIGGQNKQQPKPSVGIPTHTNWRQFTKPKCLDCESFGIFY